MNSNDLKLYVITDRAWLKPGETLAEAVEKAIQGGATMVQLREKGSDYEEKKALALECQSICKKYHVPFIVNDDVHLAKEIGADGVHVGQDDMAAMHAREILGPDCIVGVTAKTVEQAVSAQNAGADYLGSGAIFGSTTKMDAKSMTMDQLNEICNSVDIPVVGIGGIEAKNVAMLKGSGIAGIAVVSAVFAAENVRRAAMEMWDLLFGRRVVQCITNQVTMNDVANVILAVGGSPIMAHHPAEVQEVQEKAAGLLLNLGATDDYEAMKLAYQTAIEKNHPVVIDPVGVGGSSFRREFLYSLLEIGHPSCIRGNFGEIKAIFENTTTMAGLDNECVSEEYVVKNLAKRLHCVIVASGKTDLLSDGKTVMEIPGGSRKQKTVTGSGCMLSGILASTLAVASGDRAGRDSDVLLEKDLALAAFVCAHAGTMAHKAAEETSGSMSFRLKWLDYLSVE